MTGARPISRPAEAAASDLATDQIGFHPGMLDAEQLAGAGKAGLHFIGNQRMPC
jgi:hypothetical protein